MAYREKTHFKKVKAKANYYFDELNPSVKDDKSRGQISEKTQRDLNPSNPQSKEAKSSSDLDALFEKRDWDLKHGLGRDLKDEYFAFKRSRMESLALAAGALTVGLFLPQDLFLGFCLCSAGLATLFSKADANVMKENRLPYWTKREKDLKAELQSRTHTLENQPVSTMETQFQHQKIAHQQKQKTSDKSRQRED